MNIFRETDVQLFEHLATMHGLAALYLEQEPDVHLLALRKVGNDKKLDESVFYLHFQDFASRYNHRKKDMSFANSNDVLRVQYEQQQRSMHVGPWMVVMPKHHLRHHVRHRRCDDMSHQGVKKYMPAFRNAVRPVIKPDVVNRIKQCKACQQVPTYPAHRCRASIVEISTIWSNMFN